MPVDYVDGDNTESEIHGKCIATLGEEIYAVQNARKTFRNLARLAIKTWKPFLRLCHVFEENKQSRKCSNSCFSPAPTAVVQSNAIQQQIK